MKTISAALALWPIWRSPCNEMLFTYFEIPFFSPVCRSFLSGALYFAPKPTTNLDWNACLLSVRSIPSTYSILALELGSHRPKSTKILIRGYYHGVTEDWRWTDPEAMRLVQRKMGENKNRWIYSLDVGGEREVWLHGRGRKGWCCRRFCLQCAV